VLDQLDSGHHGDPPDIIWSHLTHRHRKLSIFPHRFQWPSQCMQPVGRLRCHCFL